MIRNRKILKVFAVFTAINMLVNIFAPTVSYALTSGPSQPEFSSFEPVATTNMVNEFTGDFTYNLPIIEIPGPHGSSYPMSLSYHSGVSPEEEASWVGYGWTLNAGAINRGLRGFPDDYRGNKVTYYNKTRPNWTITGGLGVSVEGFSLDVGKLSTKGGVSIGQSLRYNNYKGFGVNTNIGLSLGNGVISVGYNVSDGDGSFSLSLNPMKALNNSKDKNAKANNDKVINHKKLTKLKDINVSERLSSHLRNAAKQAVLSKKTILGSQYGIFSYNTTTYPSNVFAYKGTSINVSVGGMLTPTSVQVGVEANFFGNFTIQKNLNNQEDISTYGYLYSSEAISDEGKPTEDELNDPDGSYQGHGAMMDYILEKETPYNKRKKFLGVPFNNADMFALSGEGLGGGFRFYNKGIGQFRPNSKISRTKSFNVGAEFEVFVNNGGGTDIGMGFHKLIETDWDEGISSFKNAEDENEDEPVFLRFANDLGGSWEYKNIKNNDPNYKDDDPIRADVVRSGSHYDVSLNEIDAVMNDGERSQRSSFIDYTKNEDMLAEGNAGRHYKAYSKREDLNNFVNRSNTEIANEIGEFAITKEDGSAYIYGLPVYAKEEKRMSYGVSGATSEDGFFIYGESSKDGKTEVGQEMKSPYATAHLLTEIRTSDYIDREFDGPTLDDFGGYTRFNYTNKYGVSSSWYKWRLPYRGLTYNRNSLSDAMDDLGNESEGKKQIYYLKSVETKTHVAIFTTSEREDGRDAPTDAMSRNAAPGNHKLNKLDKIDLYTINDFQRDGAHLKRDSDGSPILKAGAVPIKTVHFRYAGYDGESASNELAKNVPNASGGHGKLTLKKVWFEYKGIQKAKISPYIFNYKYSRDPYPTRYQFIQNEYPDASLENPDYSKYAVNAWGNYRDAYLGMQRFSNMQTWVDQSSSVAYDPAAWQLKTIVLPTGGEIQVQYERKDYSYVQDQEAHAMISLQSVQRDPGGDKFYLNTADLGLSENEKDIMINLINRRYGPNSAKKKKIYFSFLYTMLGNNVPDLRSCNAEYINGYAQVLNAGKDANGVFIKLESADNGGYNTPRSVCKDFVMTQRAGKIEMSGNCDPSSSGFNPDTNADPKTIAKGLVKKLANYRMAQQGFTVCMQFNNQLS